MGEPVKASRRYRSTLRTEQAEATRERIAATAHDMFIQDGYAAATIRAVAARGRR